MNGSGASGEERILQGDFGEQWLEMVASAVGIDHGRVGSTDLDKADVQLTLRGEHNGWMSPSVKVQVKTTTNFTRDENGDLVYNLDAATHNFLCKKNHATGRTLVVIGLSDQGDRVRHLDEATELVGVARWTCLMGDEATDNTSTYAIRLPNENGLDEAGLKTMIKTFGVPRTNVVHEYDPWQGVEVDGAP